MKRIIIAFLAILLLASAVSAEDWLPVDGVYPINSRDYAPNAVKLFNMAEKTIKVIVYQARYYEEYNDPNSSYNLMYTALKEAVKRGVDVSIIVDQSSWNASSSVKNEEFAEFMREGGVKVYFEPPDITTHSKIVIVDTEYTIVGSTNWSFYALDRNHECSVIVKSVPVAEAYDKYFERLLMFSDEEMSISDIY